MDAIAIVVLVVYAAVLVVSAVKGKWWFTLFSLFIPLFFVAALTGAIRLAKPTSFWARRFYDREQLDESVQRFLSEEEYAEFRERTGASKEEIGGRAPPID